MLTWLTELVPENLAFLNSLTNYWPLNHEKFSLNKFFFVHTVEDEAQMGEMFHILLAINKINQKVNTDVQNKICKQYSWFQNCEMILLAHSWPPKK